MNTVENTINERRSLHTDIQRVLIQERLRNANRDYQHPSFVLEQMLTDAIREGEISECLDILERINNLERAELSSDPIRSLKNSLIGSCTIFARAAISGGVDSESAFMLSDLFIRQIERVNSKLQAESLEYDMLIAFVASVNDSRQANEEDAFSPAIVRARAYIRQHINSQLSLVGIAEEIGIHPNYLSTLFSKECGETFMKFVDRERISAITRYLAHTNTSLSSIATNFSFNSFSHFSTYFKKQTGQSPRDYRKSLQTSLSSGTDPSDE